MANTKYRLRVVTLEDDSEIYYPQVWIIVGWYNLDRSGNVAVRGTKCYSKFEANEIIDLHKNFLERKKIKKIDYEDL